MSGSSPAFDHKEEKSKTDAPQVKVSLKNTFLNIDEESASHLLMPDLLRAQTTPAVFSALQALYSGTQQVSNSGWSIVEPMESVDECGVVGGVESEPEDPSPEFNAEDVLRQLSETLSAMNYDGSSSESAVSGRSIFTTVMLRNIPNKYTAIQLMEEFERFGFVRGEIDFFYLPIDFRNVCNVGFAFVNFRLHERAEQFMQVFDNYRLPATNSSKICAVCWARVQGRESNIDQYRDSPISEEYRPWLFTESGEREAFPQSSDPEVVLAIEKSSKEALRASHATKGPDANKIFVGGLDRATGGSDLVSYFSQFGAVKDAAVVIDRTSGKSRGFGFCLFERAVPRAVLVEQHVIGGCQVAVKMYEESNQGSSSNRRRNRVKL